MRSQVKNPIIQVKPIQKIENKSHAFYDSEALYWAVFSIFGLMPIRKDKNGNVKIKYLCPCSLYCFLFYAGMTYPAFYSLKQRFVEIQNPKNTFEDIIFAVVIAGIISMHFMIPWTHWLEFRSAEKVFAKWKKFEIDYRSTTGTNINFLTKQYVNIRFLLVCVLTTIPSAIAAFVIFEDYSIMELIVFPYMFFIFQLHFSLLMINSEMIITVMGGFKKNFRKVIIEKGKWDLIARYNALWIDIAELTEAVGGMFYKINGLMLLGYFTSLTMNGFSAVNTAVDGLNNKRLMACMSCVLGSLLLFITCKVGNKVHREVGEKFIDELVDYKAHHSQDKEFQDELEIFIDSIQITPHKISYQGYVKVDNALFVSMLSTVITYLVVVVQFSLS